MKKSRSLRRWMAKSAIALGAVVCALLGIVLALAVFSNPGGTQTNSFTAASINAQQQPSASVSGRDVTVSWPADTATGGTPTTYSVLRDNAAASGTCSGTQSSATLSCTDTGVPSGAHTYKVVPTYLSWSGPSASVTSAAVGTPSLSLSPTTTTVPATLSGSIANFIDGETVSFKLDSTGGTALTGTLNSTATPTTVPTGGSASVTVSLPGTVSQGAHTVYIVGGQGDTASVGVFVKATPTIAVTHAPASPTLGQSVTFTATVTGPSGGPTPSGTVSWTLTGQATSCGSTTALSGSTNVATATCVITASTAGTYNASASVAADTNYTAAGPSNTDSFTVATVSLSPNSGNVGSVVTLSGSSFPANSTITATYAGSAVTLSGTTTTDSSGNIPTSTPPTFTIPATAPGSLAGAHAVVVTAGGRSASANFTVTPSITLTPSNGVAGTTDTITGNGFAASSGLTATFNGTGVTLSGTTSTNANGVITPGSTYTVPNLAAGGYSVVVSDASSNSASATYTINTPSAAVSPTSGVVGTTVTLSGSNFPANATITATYDGSAVTLSGTTTTTATGGIPTSTPPTFVVPASAFGLHTVVVSVSTRTASASFSVTPSESLNPNSGIVGTTVTLSGAGFPANSTITATYSGSAVTLSGTTTTDAAGTIPTSTPPTFVVPASTFGIHAVVVTAGGQSAPSANFSVTPSASVNPASGNVGSTVTLSGNGYPAGATITATYAGSAITLSGTTTTDASGNIPTSTPPTFTVPATAPGSLAGAHAVVVSAGGQSAPSVNYTVTPSITLNPTSGVAGTTDTITGTGFAATSTVTATFNGSAVTLGGTPSTTANGALTTGATYTVPNLAPGAYSVVVKDASNNQGTATFTINTPSVAVSPTSGVVGTTVTLSGSNFPANSTISATYGGSAVTLSGTTSTTATGGIPTTTPPTFVVPASTFGSHAVVVTAGGQSASTSFSVTPSASVSPSSGNVGSTVTLSGSGYPASATITATYAGSAITLSGSTTTDGSGNIPTSTPPTFTVPATAPGSVAGAHAVVVSAGGQSAPSVNYTVTPSITLNPTNGVAGMVDTITGTGFAAGSTVTATFNGSAVTLGGTTLTTANGALTTGATYTVPNLAAAGYSVVVSDGSGNQGSATFTINTPSVAVSPTSGAVGTTVTLSGSNFPASSTITATYGGSGVTLSGTTTTTATGGIPTTTPPTFVVPASTFGSHPVVVTVATRTASTSFSVTPSASVSPTSGNVGSTVTLSGNGYPATATITATYAGSAITLSGSTTTDASGNIPTSTPPTFTVPATAPGSLAGAHAVVVSAGGQSAPSVNYSVTPSITLNPTSGAAGSTDTITGTGFAAGSTVTATFNGSAVTLSGTTAATTNGALTTGATYTVPSLAAGAYTVVVTDGSSNAASATFTITASTAPQVQSIATQNGNVAHTIDTGDQIIITYSQAMDTTTLCAGWNGSSQGGPNISFSHNGGTGSDSKLTFTAGASCSSPNFGSIDLGASWGGNDSPAYSTVIAYSGTTLTMTLTKTAGNFTPSDANSVTLTYTPSTSAKGTNGLNLGGTAATATGVQF